ncbi:hypothetical protein AJ80_00165 [Polytolypa hystricis UAMH7299]|uniref:Major facilitator superfamily (MFS) profile domain-containing protein n=1 Tax=Polytolypa hystricis (strain UAMH7299) TaxID=1447883 RepID=A0A2B7YW12_POLH7|nr:hypothetical protein AJ80_00165 [Polytolypa hystricis UAMH7299]
MAPTVETTDFVPGTVRLVDVGQAGSGKDIMLVPRPSADPEDPLNWTRKRKMRALLMVYLYNIAVGIPTSLQYSVLPDISRDTGIDISTLVQGNGLMILFFGWGPCIVWQPLALTYGRRGVYLLSTLLIVPVMVWTAYSQSAGEWYAHRVIIGIIASPFEVLPEVTVFDLFFAHERGAFTSLYVFVLFSSTFIAPLVAGWFNDAFGWRWTMHFGGIVAAVCFVVLFFFLEETIYFRGTVEGEYDSSSSGSRLTAPSTFPLGHNQEEQGPKSSPPGQDVKPGDPSTPTSSSVGSTTAMIRPASSPSRRSPFVPSFRLFTPLPGRPSNLEMLRMVYRPVLMIFQFPTVAWSGFLYGINLAWYNVLNATVSPILSAEPYNWSAAKIGCVYTGPIIGAAFACAWCGPLADRFALTLARRNGGIREPEQRLWPLLVSGVVSAAGLILWGVGADHEIHWVGLVVGLALMTFGCVTGGAIAVSYNVDCFKEMGGESTVSVMMIRNTIGFGFSYAITPWYTNMGLQNCFITAAMVSIVCTMTFLLMVKYGKTLRRMSTEKYLRYISSVGVKVA